MNPDPLRGTEWTPTGTDSIEIFELLVIIFGNYDQIAMLIIYLLTTFVGS